MKRAFVGTMNVVTTNLWSEKKLETKPLKPWIEAIEDVSKVRDVQVIKTF